MGLVDRSSSQLEYQLYRDDPNQEIQTGSLSIKPSTLVLFNGDKLYHRVTPLGENEEHIVRIIPINEDLWVERVQLEWHHRDLADRVVVALVNSNQTSISTADKKIRDFYSDII